MHMTYEGFLQWAPPSPFPFPVNETEPFGLLEPSSNQNQTRNGQIYLTLDNFT